MKKAKQATGVVHSARTKAEGICRRAAMGLAALLLVSPLHAGTLARFHTALGDIDVELYHQDKPATVQNFLNYVQSGRYQNMIAHRWEAGFVLQGGGVFIADRFTTNEAFTYVPISAAITNEYSVGRTFSNIYGTIAMARVGGQTNSATSQWFFNLADNSFLDSEDGGFTVFGYVANGTNVLNRFNDTSVSNGIYSINLGSPLDELPVYSTNPTFEDLVYVDISIFTIPVQLSRSNGTVQISWTSVNSLTNYVEFATNLPPAWQSLAVTNGNGGQMTVIDPNLAAPQRFYRVRAGY